MSIAGRIAIDVNFADSSDATGVQSLKKILLVDTSSYSSGKVALVTGTVGTAAITINTANLSPAYRDAAGQAVSFASVSRIAFECTRDCVAQDEGQFLNRLRSNNQLAVGNWTQVGTAIELEAQFTSGTASYTLVLYGT
jgi:hypothetical protein